MMGNAATGELLALKRVTVGVKGKSRTCMLFPAADEHGDSIKEVDLYLLSDSYQGLDQAMQINADAYGRSDSKASYMRGPGKPLDHNGRDRKGSGRSDHDTYGAEEAPCEADDYEE